MYKKILSIALVAMIAAVSLIGTVAAEEMETKDKAAEVCGFEVPDQKVYNAEFVTIRRQLRIEPGESFRVKVFFKNTGNMPWFSDESTCLGPRMELGTKRSEDRVSKFYTESVEGVEDTGWIAKNRVKMDQLRVDPGHIASFTFYGEAPDSPDVIKEYFAPVVKNIQWVNDAEFFFELMVGDTGESPIDLRQKLTYASKSGSVSHINLDGEKKILVDLSEQRMYAYLDDMVIRDFPISTGKASTPTPTGTTSISLKQEVRVGHKAPHYIMPKFMMFRAGGYGIHALPSLAGDGGWFWTEARSHIGIPVSHGCIRLLPEDADFMFDFTPLGTPVVVQW